MNKKETLCLFSNCVFSKSIYIYVCTHIFAYEAMYIYIYINI